MSSRHSNPLMAVPSFVITIGGEVIAYSVTTMEYFFALIGAGATYSYFTKDEFKNISTLPIISLKILQNIFKFFIHLPKGILNLMKGFLNNIQVFFNVFIILVVLGRFDWLLEDMYSLIAITLLITWITIRT